MATEKADSKTPRPRQGEQGFVLLTLPSVAAAVAVQLAIVLPRAAVEAQRIREERLIYRGKQYKRAIELYFRKFQKYPEEIDDLEDTNGQRFLRRRYKDPLTGEDDWRIIHMGADGRFVDSLIYDTEDPEELARQGMGQGGGGFGSGMGIGGAASGTSPSAQTGGYAQPSYNQPYNQNQPYDPTQLYDPNQQGFVSPDGRFRGADRARAVRQSAAPEYPTQAVVPIPGEPGEQQGQFDPNDPNAPQGGVPGQPGDPNQQQQPDYSRMLPNQVPPGAGPRPLPGQPGASPFGANRAGGVQSARSAQRRGQIGIGQGGFNQGQQRGQQRMNQPGGQPLGFGTQGAGNQAAQVIGQLLTQPRPGGLAGLRGSQRQARAGGQAAFQGGIAGVASKVEERGIKVYEGKEAYHEWEFVFDHRKAQALGTSLASGAPGVGLPAGQPGLTSNTTLSGAPGAAPAGTVGTGSPSPAYPPAYPTTGQPGPGTPYGQQRRRGQPNQPGRSPFGRRSGSPGLPGTAPNLPGMNQPRRGTQRGQRPGPGQPTTNQPRSPGSPFPGANQQPGAPGDNQQPGAPGANQQPGNQRTPQRLIPGLPSFPNQQGNQQGNQQRGSTGRR